MDKDVAAEVGKIAALVARLGGQWEFDFYQGKLMLVRHDSNTDWGALKEFNIIKTRKTRRIPMLRALADKLRAELKEQAKCKP